MCYGLSGGIHARGHLGCDLVDGHRYADEPEDKRTSQPWAYDWNAAPPFDAKAFKDLGESIRHELSRMGVTKPMRFSPGENA